MAKSSNQKLKLLYLTKIFMEKTDEAHGLSLSEITELLNGYDISAERKTLYQDFDELKRFGLDIISEKRGKTVVYSLASRDFELAELKLLVDCVQSARFITEKKSRDLIKKLEGLVSENDAKQLHRQVIIAGRVKTANESILINVDHIHSAINSDRQISFQYFQWKADKSCELRHGGRRYYVSPWALVWDDENYYMIGYDSDSEMIKHYRVDKMLSLEQTDVKRDGQRKLSEMNIAAYSKRLFGMHGGKTERVTLKCRNDMAGVIIDRFGADTSMALFDEEHFTAAVDVIPSGQFIGWVIGLGEGVKIISPESVVEKVKSILKTQAELYEKQNKQPN